VKDSPGLVRDTQSKAILNTDNSALNKYKQERDFKIKLAQVVADNDQLKSDVNSIKSTLQSILDILNRGQ